jgi:hypothetical protein
MTEWRIANHHAPKGHGKVGDRSSYLKEADRINGPSPAVPLSFPPALSDPDGIIPIKRTHRGTLKFPEDLQEYASVRRVEVLSS